MYMPTVTRSNSELSMRPSDTLTITLIGFSTALKNSTWFIVSWVLYYLVLYFIYSRTKVWPLLYQCFFLLNIKWDNLHKPTVTMKGAFWCLIHFKKVQIWIWFCYHSKAERWLLFNLSSWACYYHWFAKFVEFCWWVGWLDGLSPTWFEILIPIFILFFTLKVAILQGWILHHLFIANFFLTFFTQNIELCKTS